jgi:WD40 repeat protein
LPITSLRFCPGDKNVLVGASADGSVFEYKLKTKQPKKTWEITEEKNEIYTMDISADGKEFATAGQDKKVRIYDYETRKVSSTLYKYENDEDSNGHTNRIYSVIFNPKDSNMLLSGGWDDTIQIWDIRQRQSAFHIFGPHICSDSLDIYENMLLAGSMRTTNQLQLFDLRNPSESQSVKWSKGKEEKQCLVYTCKFHPNGEYFIAAGAGDTKVRSFSTKTLQHTGKSAIFSSPIYSISLTDSAQDIVIGTQDGNVFIYGIQFTRN